jgi:threonine dehydrogenase-like Zn-dependent dehydrogenase
MRAVVCRGPRDYVVEQVDDPQAGDDEAVLLVEAVGICAGDVKCFQGAPMFWGDETRPRYVEPPVMQSVHGAMAEYLRVPSPARVHRISPDLPASHAAFAEPLSCSSLHARRGGAGGSVVVATPRPPSEHGPGLHDGVVERAVGQQRAKPSGDSVRRRE